MKHDALIAPDESQFAFTPKISGFAASNGATDTITVPDAELLFQGTFKRDGDDLKIVGKDGNAFLVDDYFAHDKKPTLLSPEGASLSSAVVESLAGPLAAGQYAQAGTPQSAGQAIGRVEKAEGNATVVRNGVTITLNTGDVIQKGDVAQTGAGGSLAIVFADGTAFNLAANARMVLNDFVYSAGGSNNSALISLVQGSISFVAGQVAKTGDMRVDTPVATMGIRGTAVLVEISANNGQTKFSVMVEPNGTTGSFNLYNKTTGSLIGTVNSSTIGWVVTPAGPLEVVAQQVQKTPAELARELAIMQQVFNTFNAGPFDPNAPQQQPQDPGRRGDNPQNTNTADGSSYIPQGSSSINPTFTPQGNTVPGTNGTPTNPTDPTGPTNPTGPGEGPTTTADPPPPPPIPVNNVYGSDGNDNHLEGTEGNDFLYAGAGDDIIFAAHGGGDDFYDGDGDNDQGFAGPGFDTIRFDSANGVVFDLRGIVGFNQAYSPSTGHDVFINIEKVVASPGDDVFNLHTNDNWHIDGGEGIDTIALVGNLSVGEHGEDGPDIRGIEVIDLNETHDNTVSIEGIGAIEAIYGNDDEEDQEYPNDSGNLVFNGGLGDRVYLMNEDHAGVWRLAADDPAKPGYAVYIFTADDDETEAVVYIDKDINADIIENVTVTFVDDGGFNLSSYAFYNWFSGSEISAINEGDGSQSIDFFNATTGDHFLLTGEFEFEYDEYENPVSVIGGTVTGIEITNSGYTTLVTAEGFNFSFQDLVDALEAFATDDGAALDAIFSQVAYDFRGGNGPDKMEGGAFGDKFNGAGGDDSMTGHGGADTFVAHGVGHAVITDFSITGGDRIDVSGFSQLRHMTDIGPLAHPTGVDAEHPDGTGTVIDFGNGDVLTLPGVILKNLTDNDFLFANDVTVEDRFNSQAYNLNDGSNDWATNWTETNDDFSDALNGSPTDGEIFISHDPTASSGNFQLTLTDKDAEGDNADTIQRSVDLTGTTSATLTFDYRRVDMENGDDIQIYASNGGNFELIGEIQGNGLDDQAYQTFTFDLTRFISANTTIQFAVDDRLEDGDTLYIDNVKITYLADETPSNKAPAISFENAYTEGNDDSTTLAGLSVSDADDNGGDDIFTVSITSNSICDISLVDDHGVTDGDGSPNDVYFQTSLTNLNDILTDGINYSNPVQDSGESTSDTVTLTVTDPNGISDTLRFVFNNFGTDQITLTGTTGKDVLFGTGYTDTLTGGGSGGDGSDTFVFSFEEYGFGNDTVTDFDVSQDRIVLDGGSIGDFGQLSIRYEGGSATIDLGEDGTIVLNNVLEDSLQASNFAFRPDLQ